eukprot:COSAG04_NODE_8900_length_919_cov_0.829268_1_plen_175_part_10
MLLLIGIGIVWFVYDRWTDGPGRRQLKLLMGVRHLYGFGDEHLRLISKATAYALRRAGCGTKTDVDALKAETIVGLGGTAPQELAEYLLRDSRGAASDGIVGTETLLSLVQAGCRKKTDVQALDRKAVDALAGKASQEVLDYVLCESLSSSADGVVKPETIRLLIQADCCTKADV